MRQEIPCRRVLVGPVAVVLLINALVEGPHTYADLVESTGFHRCTLARWLAQFRKPTGGYPKLVRIAEWHVDSLGRFNTPAFAWGSKPDAKRKPLSNVDRKRRQREGKARRRLAKVMAWPPVGVDRVNRLESLAASRDAASSNQ